MSKIKWRPEIDGLRAIAVLPVILFHLNESWCRGGFLGVDVFFVISGFLITSIILAEHETESFSLRRFWQRRIQRILPVLSVVVSVVLTYMFMTCYRPELLAHGSDAAASMLSIANFAMWHRVGNYWGTAAEQSPFLHTWSLSVEEQFYLLYPLFVIWILRRRWNLPASIGAVGMVSFALFAVLVTRKPTATFYLLPTRIWELSAGCILAALVRDSTFRLSRTGWSFGVKPVASSLGLALVLGSIFFIDGNGSLSVFLAVPVVGTALILFDDSGAGPVNTLLSMPMLRWIGKLSYSMYIWHWPIIALAKRHATPNDTATSYAVLLPAILLVSAASYYFIETPIRHSPRGTFYGLSLHAATLLVAASIAYGNYDVTYPSAGFSVVQYFGKTYDLSPHQQPIPRELLAQQPGTHVPTRDPNIGSEYKRGGLRNDLDGMPRIVLWGDSHGTMWARVIEEVCDELDAPLAINVMAGTSPFFNIPPTRSAVGTKRWSADEKFMFDEAKLKSLREWQPELLILSCKWSANLMWKTQLDDLLELTKSLGTKVLLINEPPMLAIGNNLAGQYVRYLGLRPREATRQYLPALEEPNYVAGLELVREKCAEFTHCNYVDAARIFVNEKSEAWVIEGKNILYFDDDHLSYTGTLKVRERLCARILGLCPSLEKKLTSRFEVDLLFLQRELTCTTTR